MNSENLETHTYKLELQTDQYFIGSSMAIII